MSNTINPNQIRPYPAEGDLVGTLDGETVPLKIVAGTGINVSISGNNIVISTSGSPLTITSFTGSQSGELGQNFVNPSFAAAYAGSPTSANITNTDSIDSPHTLTTPFTP